MWAISFVFAYFGTFYDDPQFLAVFNVDLLCIFPTNYSNQAMKNDEHAIGTSTNYNFILQVSNVATTLAYVIVFGHFVVKVMDNLTLISNTHKL